MAATSNEKRILVVIPTSTLTQRQLLEGLLQYAHESNPGAWHFHLDLHDLNRQHIRDLKSWNCQGIIAYILSARERRAYLATGLPAVFIEPTLAKPIPLGGRRNVVTFVNDHSAEGRTAAKYFIERRYSSFAYIGTARPTFWSDARLEGFRTRLAEAGFSPIVYPPPQVGAQDDFAQEAGTLARWLKSLPRKTALFCVHDRRAQQVIATAAAAGVRVPEDVAVLGVDNDELLCELTVPSISSIPVAHCEWGMAVGEAMDRLLSHRRTERTIVTRHETVITRTSTNSQAIADPFVARAVAYALDHLQDRPSLPELARVAGCSKTVLNIRARRALGRTMADELTHLRLNAAMERLSDVDATVEEVAQKCGFCGASHLGLRMKSALGITPGECRKGMPTPTARSGGATRQASRRSPS